MDTQPTSHSLFEVYLRLRPANTVSTSGDRFLDVDVPEPSESAPKHITLNPPADRRRAIEKFAFTQVFEEDATQLDVFHCTGVAGLVEGVLAPYGDGTDALLATLGVTGSGKTHTMLGTRSQRGLTQMSLDLIYRSLGHRVLDPSTYPNLEQSISASDPSEANILPATAYLESVYSTDPTISFLRGSGNGRSTPLQVRPSASFSARPFASVSSRVPTDKPICRTSSTSSVAHQFGARTPAGPFQQAQRSASIRLVVTEEPEQEEEESTVFFTPPSRAGTVTPTQTRTSRLPCPSPSGLGNSFLPRSSRLPTYQPQRVGTSPAQPQQQLRPVASSTLPRFTATSSLRFATITPATRPSNRDQQNESSTPRRFRPSALPQNPDISHLTIPFDASAEYAIVISMYEVYNDRIFDLLSSPVKSAATKEYRRRPLLFKPTELSPDRKVVAGLRKVVCGSLDQALMVLEAGLQERRVAGTESNTQSSRSHGFFVVEVKKRFSLGGQHTGWYGGAGWTGNSLTIVDLAGSERARDAKTVGQTLAEAGKINESLMYLGQCLQMQVAGGKEKPNLGLIRRCKLTELLFTNSFPTGNNQQQHRNPQKGIMIVTADPHGDFNATSQILRYSALAKEVTVPRQPPSFPPPNSFSNSLPPIGSPNHQYLSFQQTLESAALEISRLQEDLTYLRHALDSERSLREQAEAHLLSMEDKMVELEQAIREDCAEEFEKRLELEVNRWKTIVDGERERGEEFWRGKWGVFERMVEADGDVDMDMDVDSPKKPENTRLVETRTAEGQEARRQLEILADENERLQRENESLKQALAACIDPAKSTSKNKSPSRRSPSRSRRKKAQLNYAEDDDGFFQELKRDQGDMAMDGFGEGNGVGGSHGTGSPTKKKRIRRLGAKKWGQGLDDDDPF
ncbi:putative kinesin group protein [Neurospora crassa]|uniref:Kinesin family protein n=1 Tax=Neurospora crassa (strain ATCC 24698 / 74-OR23-1A / CBS 708.71 / DSM 1257 / FGSC 987) TaxID=367110 RepID=V5IP47_NEUCR|nr:kinesin family protein [Neurospora crassa OR74A]ESA43105.1 kinesin family protein [Neurospora crassa OR74A]KHE79547.1 putative kinesin group protein [Neurospora crassa]|eukprot:XP_011394125.1 kinesin family protein [Neurospora crassa OR74A]